MYSFFVQETCWRYRVGISLRLIEYKQIVTAMSSLLPYLFLKSCPGGIILYVGPSFVCM